MYKGGGQDTVSGASEYLINNKERVIGGGDRELPSMSPPPAPLTSSTFVPGKVGDEDLNLVGDYISVDTRQRLNEPFDGGDEGRDLVAEEERKGAFNNAFSLPFRRPSLPVVGKEDNDGDTSVGDASHKEKVMIESETEVAFAVVKNGEVDKKQADIVEGMNTMIHEVEREDGIVGAEVAEETKIPETQMTEMIDTLEKSEATVAGMEETGNEEMDVAEKTITTAIGDEEYVNKEVKIPEMNAAEKVTEPFGAEKSKNEEVEIPERNEAENVTDPLVAKESENKEAKIPEMNEAEKIIEPSDAEESENKEVKVAYMDDVEQLTKPMTEMAEEIENLGMQRAETMDEVEEFAAMADLEEDTDMADMEEVMTGESEMTDMAQRTEGIGQIEMTKLASEMEKSEGPDLAEVEEGGRSFHGKRKRGRNVKVASRVLMRKKMEEDVCFVCFDGGDLVLCDRR